MGKRLYVGNLPYSAGESDLESKFSPYGTVESTNLIIDRNTGRSKGFAFVELASEEIINEIIIKYLNRLSDFFFVLSRWVNKELNQNEA